jgi:hypothetical protein
MKKDAGIWLLVWVLGCLGQTHPTLDNTVICGYQGWFACYGDGSPVDRWNHWCGGKYQSDTPKPSPGNQSGICVVELERRAAKCIPA